MKCDAVHIEYYMKTAKDVDILHQPKLLVNMKICLPCCLQKLFSLFRTELVLNLVEVIFHGLTYSMDQEICVGKMYCGSD